MSANRTTRLLQLRSGWRRVAKYLWFRKGDFPTAEAPRRRKNVSPPRPSLVARAQGMAERLVRRRTAKARFHGFDERVASMPPEFSVSATPRIADMAELVSQRREPARRQHLRDETYYRWRYSNPMSSYRFVSYGGSGNGSEGFFVLQQQKPMGPVTIVDWETSSPALWMELLRAIVDATPDPLQIGSTTFSDEQLDSLDRPAFAPDPTIDTRTHPAPGIFIRSLSACDEDESSGSYPQLDSDHWDIRLICSDAY